MQFVMVFKCLKFNEKWNNPQAVSLPEGALYTATGNAKVGESELRVVVEFEPGKVQTYIFKVPTGKIVGVSIPENLVFIPEVTKPEVVLGVKL